VTQKSDPPTHTRKKEELSINCHFIYRNELKIKIQYQNMSLQSIAKKRQM